MNNEIRNDLIHGAFDKYPHDVYVSYDELTDELIIRVIDPATPVYVQEFDDVDDHAVLVELESNEIVGYELFNFERDHLQQPIWSNMKKSWSKIKEYYQRHGYRKFLYTPLRQEKVIQDDFMMQNRIGFQSELQKILA